MDSSQHQWIETIPEKWWVIAMIDDATNEIPYAKFFPKDVSSQILHIAARQK